MVGLTLTEVGILSHGVAAAAYLLLTLLVVYRWKRALSGLVPASAALVTALWAAAISSDLRASGTVGALAQFLEIARSSAWMLLILSLLARKGPGRASGWRYLVVGGCLAAAIVAVPLSAGVPALRPELGQQIILVANLALALMGLGLVENLLRNASRAEYWSVKYLCFGVGALFAFDFYLYSDAVLFRHLSPDLFIARGAADLLVAPLLAIFVVRSQKSGSRVTISKRVVFHSATLIGAGLYLMTMAAAGYYVRSFGGSWSTFLQAVFFFGAMLLLVVPISSSSVRAYLRVLIEKSFFKYKYDYREEWLRFIRTMSLETLGQGLKERVIEAVCNIVDSPDGGIWLRHDAGPYLQAGAWNLSRWGISPENSAIPAESALASFLERTQWIVSLDQYQAHPGRYEGLTELPVWLSEAARAWLVVPLLHHEELFGIMVLGRSRSARDVNWEDFDILKTVGRQAASYLAQQETSNALAQARQFESFNKRFAFVVHDIKNLVSQLSLILSNAAKHRANAAFQDDMIETVRQSVEKMNRMLKQLHSEPEHAAGSAVDLVPLLRKVVASRSELGSAVSLDLRAGGMAVVADEDRLKAVVEHLVQNAVEAVGAEGQVQVRLSGEDGMAVVEIEDNGPGMDHHFVREKLFQPFATTKGTGYGIGAYESREFARALGGQLDVRSEPGRGTVMRMLLPAVVRG